MSRPGRPGVTAPVALAMAVVAGVVLAVQTRINGELAHRLGSAPLATLVSFSTGAAVLVVLVLGSGEGRQGIRRLRLGPVRWYWWLGGLIGAGVVWGASDGSRTMGVSLVSVCLVAGSVGGGVLVDRLGFGPGGHRPLSRRRLVGAALAVAAVALSAGGDLGTTFRPLLLTLLVVAGVASAAQQALNGQLAAAAGTPRTAALANFTVGSLALLALVAGVGIGHPQWPGTPWVYLGGPIGTSYVMLSALVVGVLGVLRLALGTVAGQLLGSLALDAVAPLPGARLHAATLLGVVLTLLAVGIASTGGTRTARPGPVLYSGATRPAKERDQ